jgi:hypothetical protein
VAATRYTVRSGDTLWHIAGATLGSAAQWRRIWRYNNRPAVMRITGRGIPNPDLIYPGQLLLIPSLPGENITPALPAPPPLAVTSRTPPPLPPAPLSGQPERPRVPDGSAGGPLSEELKRIASPVSLKYRLDDLKFPPIVQPGVTLEMRMTGDVLLMTQRTYPALYVTQRKEIEAQVVTQANHAYGALVGDNRFVYDDKQKSLTFRSMLVSQSNTPNTVATAVGVQMDTKNPVPKLRFEFRIPKLSGAIPPFNYTAIDVKVVVELTPNGLPPQGPSAQFEHVQQPSSSWNKLIGAGLLAGAVVVVVGTLVEDFFTAGAGTVDDPASFALSSAAVLRGLQLLKGATVVLPVVAVPGAMSLSFGVTVPSSASLGQAH